MNMEYKTCGCGQLILVYVIKYERDSQPQAVFFDASTEDYKQVFICPNCNEQLEYSNLGD